MRRLEGQAHLARPLFPLFDNEKGVLVVDKAVSHRQPVRSNVFRLSPTTIALSGAYLTKKI